MIDPVHSLAFSIQGNRGVYALLLGSGVSRASGIPTGWEVTLDLVRRLAALQGADLGSAPEQWYQEKYGQEPDYSDLLEDLAKTPAERQQVLRAYWEPNEQEREYGRKQPTSAQRSIAALAAQGFIRVIVTTNFDRLIENALRDAGIEPTVISSPDQVKGALPLVHTNCCVIKLHGDYLDTRIRNTSAELQSYPSEFNKLLDQIFDEFGLIVCGWSAEWDYALRDAIYRCQSRRFATYWATRGVPGEEAERLIGHRKAETITIASADAFFQTLRDYVEAVEEFSRPHPLSTEATIAILKRYMSESRYRIQHSDLIHDAVRKALEETSTDGYDVNRHQPNGESFSTRVRGYDVACSTLLAMAPVAGFWAEPEHYPVWERALSRLANVEQRGGYTVWLSLEPYPALLLLFALGIGVLEARRIELLSQLFFVPTHEPNEGNLPAGVVLPRHCLSGDTVTLARALPGVGNIRFPFSKWIYTVVREHTRNIIPSEKQYAFVFAKFELLLALGFGHHEDKRFGYWAPPGTFVYLYEERRRAVNEIQESLTRQNDESPYVQCGIFGDTAESCRQEIDNLMAFLPKLGSF